MNKDIKSILVDEKEIEEIVTRIAKQITEDYKNRESNLLLLCILKGSVVFMGDLMKRIELPVEIDFMKVSSYGGGSKSSKNINIILDLHRDDLENVDILIVEDIIDSGKTPEDIIKILLEGYEIEIFDTSNPSYNCDCSRERTDKALISIGKEELEKIINEDGKAEITCHFCDNIYSYTKEELMALYESAK